MTEHKPSGVLASPLFNCGAWTRLIHSRRDSQANCRHAPPVSTHGSPSARHGACRRASVHGCGLTSALVHWSRTHRQLRVSEYRARVSAMERESLKLLLAESGRADASSHIWRGEEANATVSSARGPRPVRRPRGHTSELCSGSAAYTRHFQAGRWRSSWSPSFGQTSCCVMPAAARAATRSAIRSCNVRSRANARERLFTRVALATNARLLSRTGHSSYTVDRGVIRASLAKMLTPMSGRACHPYR